MWSGNQHQMVLDKLILAVIFKEIQGEEPLWFVVSLVMFHSST